WHATAWSHLTVDTNRTDVRAPHDIAGRLQSTSAAIDSAMLRPLSAYGARLRRVCFIDLDTGRQFVVQQMDQLAIAGGRDGLSLLPPHLPAGIVERLAHVSFGVGKGLGMLPSRLVAEIADLVPRLVQGAILAPLEPLVPARALGLLGLPGDDFGEPLVPLLDRRLDLPAADQDRLGAIGGRDHR